MNAKASRAQTMLAAFALAGLSACVQAPTEPAATAPAASKPTKVDPSTGFSDGAPIAFASIDEQKIYMVFFLDEKQIKSAEKAAAPATICGSRGLRVAAVKHKLPEGIKGVPGTTVMIVHCK